MCTRDPAGWQPGLAIDVASSGTSARIAGKGVAQKPLAPARVYALVPGESEGGSKVVTYTAPILGFEASVLFDLGATHSFVSVVFVRLFRLVVRTLEFGLAITTPVGKTVIYKRVVCECLVSICGRVLPANLVVFAMFSYNVMTLFSGWIGWQGTL